jgi:transposase-like protein
MGKKHRRQFNAELKAKIAVEAIKGQRTVQEIASNYNVHPNQVTNWKKQLLNFSPEAFSSGRVLSDQADEQLRTELYAQIGKLKVELDWLQKKSGLSR